MHCHQGFQCIQSGSCRGRTDNLPSFNRALLPSELKSQTRFLRPGTGQYYSSFLFKYPSLVARAGVEPASSAYEAVLEPPPVYPASLYSREQCYHHSVVAGAGVEPASSAYETVLEPPPVYPASHPVLYRSGNCVAPDGIEPSTFRSSGERSTN